MYLILKTTVALILALGGFALYLFTYLNESIEPTEKFVKIEKGSNQNALESLSDIGITANIIDEITLRYLGGAKSGSISLDGVNTRLSLLEAMVKGKSKSFSVTLIPGETTEIFLKTVAKEHNLSYDKLKAAYNDKTKAEEGELWPETFSFEYGSDEKEIIGTFYDFSQKKYDEIKKEYSLDEKAFRQKLIIASIIEKEAATKDEMPLVASVVYNRIAKDMPLQMDGSLNYGSYSHQKVTPERIRNDDSSYNTYKNKGLPDAPVCNPSKEAIDAANKPAKTGYLYFMKNKNGVHDFSNSYNDHLRNISNVKKSNK